MWGCMWYGGMGGMYGVCVCMSIPKCMDAQGSLKSVSGLLEMELQATVSHQMKVLEFSLAPLEEVHLTNGPPLQPPQHPFYGSLSSFNICNSYDCMKIVRQAVSSNCSVRVSYCCFYCD